MWSTLKKERFFPLDSCLLNSLSPTCCSLLLEKTRKVPILAMLVWVPFQLSHISGATVAYYFFYSGVSQHLQTKVLSGAQAGIARCCFPWKPGDDKLQREVSLAAVARHPDLGAVFYVECWASVGYEQPFLGWYCKSHFKSMVGCWWLQLSMLDCTLQAFITSILYPSFQ